MAGIKAPQQRAVGRVGLQPEAVDRGQLGVDLALLRHAVFAAGEAPQADQPVQLRGQRAAALRGDLVGRLRDGQAVRGNADPFAGMLVDLADARAVALRVKIGLQLADARLCGVQRGVCRPAVGGQKHDGIHGVELALRFFGFRAGGASAQKKQKRRDKGNKSGRFHKNFLCIEIYTKKYSTKHLIFQAPAVIIAGRENFMRL